MNNSFDRITTDPAIMGGKPCVRGMRVTVEMIVRQIAGGCGVQELLELYPYLQREDIDQSLRFAKSVGHENLDSD